MNELRQDPLPRTPRLKMAATALHHPMLEIWKEKSRSELRQDHLPTTPHRQIALPKMVATALRHPTLEI